jgi:CRISPR-associated protein Cas1
MGTLYIDRKDIEIRLDGQALAFYSGNGREGVIPLAPLKRIVMIGGVRLDTSILGRLCKLGISVLLLSGKRLEFRGILHGRLHNNGLLRLRQYEKALSEEFSLNIAREIVRRKIKGQRDFLLDVRARRPDLEKALRSAIITLQEIVETAGQADTGMDSLRGLEGGGASVYFSAYTMMFPKSLGFQRRNKRPPLDPVNAMLSLCYTMLHFEMVREIEVIGLDPTIGFYHQFDYGRESLACDLVEPHRPHVERFVWELFRDRVFTVRNFAMDDERPGCYLKKKARRRFYPLYEEWAKERRQSWVEDVRGLARRIMDGQDTVYHPDK